MASRPPALLVLRDFQQEAVERLSAAALDALRKMAAAPTERRRIARQIGCSLLQAPTGSGKTIMLGRTVEAIAQRVPVVWFWFAPFAGLVAQTASALKSSAPSLRIRDPVKDRVDVGTRSGDVFIATWASVATRRADTKRMRQEDDTAPSLDTLVASLRTAGFVIGAVVDEAHHTFRPGTEAFRFLDGVLCPDLLMCASATPDDGDLEILRRAMDVGRFQHVGVSRARVVDARLNKPRVTAVSFVARGASTKMLDLNEVALRKAVDQHRALKRLLKEVGVPIVPLLLIQAPSTDWTPARVQALLRGPLAFPSHTVAVHTAAEPDPDVQALANDPDVEVLVFKMAVATGFDAPRAFTLCALRPIVDAGFGLQVIGRIMRVHPRLQQRPNLPPDLDTGWVFIGDPQGMPGLEKAAERIKAIRDSISIVSDGLHVYEAGVGDGAIALVGEDGQSRLVLEPSSSPPMSAEETPTRTTATEEGGAPWSSGTLFNLPHLSVPLGAVETQSAPPAAPQSSPRAMPLPVRPPTLAAYRYERRSGLVVPERLRTERMPRDVTELIDGLVRNVRFTPEHLLSVRQETAPIERREESLFERSALTRRVEQSTISFQFARQNAHELLNVSQYIAPKDLGLRLQASLANALEEAGQQPVDRAVLQRALNVILVQSPNLLKDALRRAMGAHAEVVDASDLPMAWESAAPLSDSRRNLYGCVPNGLNNWELRFADWLDRQERVIWWTRNLPRPNASDDWSVRIVLPETGRGYYPDFVICVDGRKQPQGIGLAETKERIESDDSALKSRTEHREYGRALMLSYNSDHDRFLKVEYAAEVGRNREVGPLRFEDLL